MYWKRYAVFALLLVSSIALDVAIDGAMGIGPAHMLRNAAFIFRMMGPVERTLLFVLFVWFLRKPIGNGFGRLFGGSGSRTGGGGSGSPPDPADQQ